MDFIELIRAAAALAVTLGLIGLIAAGLRRFGPDAMARLVRMRRERRMQVVETLVLDPTRRLILFNLDGEERLLLLGEGKLLDWGPKAAPLPVSPALPATPSPEPVV